MYMYDCNQFNTDYGNIFSFYDNMDCVSVFLNNNTKMSYCFMIATCCLIPIEKDILVFVAFL